MLTSFSWEDINDMLISVYSQVILLCISYIPKSICRCCSE